MSGMVWRTRTGFARLALVAVVAAGSLWVTELATPRGAFACSCMELDRDAIGKLGADPAIVVFVGTIIDVRQGADNMGHTLGTLEVQQVFKGAVPARLMPVLGGGGGDCTLGIKVGQRMITAATLEKGRLTPGLCMPYGDPGTAEGQRLIAVATLAYGPGAPPPDGPPTATDPPTSPNPVPADLALPVVLGGLVVVAVLLFGGLALVARRGRAAT